MDMKKHLRTVLVLSAALGISTTMPASVVMASTNSTTASASASSTTNNSQFTKDQIAGLNHLNAIRKHMGLKPVQLSPILCKSAENHIQYLNHNNTWTVSNVHSEIAGSPYFTGGDVKARVKAVGGSFSQVGEAIGYSDNAPDVIDGFISNVYHRDILLSPSAKYIGIASSGIQYVIDVAYTSSDASVVFPYSGQKNVPLSSGDEYPNPLAQYGVASTSAGYPISIYLPNSEMYASGVKWSYSLTDSKGNNLPIYSQIGQFFPKTSLRHDETYTATATLKSSDGTVLFNKTWSFTTKLSQAQKFQAKFGKSQNGQPIGKIMINQDIGYIDASGNMGIKWHKGAVYNVYGVSIPYTGTDLYNLGKYGSINSDAGVTFFLGIVYSPSKPLTVYNSDGSVYKTFKPNQKFRVTSETGNKLYVAKDKYVLKSSSIVFQK